MRRHAPMVRDYMTHLPVESERCETAKHALETMQRHGIHHIPVMSGSHLKGLVAQRDLLAAQVRLGPNFDATSLDQVCPEQTLIVSPVDPLDEVARKMIADHTDAACVVDAGFVVGVFTTTDALRFLADFFGQPPQPS